MNIVFFGSSPFSRPTLEALACSKRHRLVGVVAQPDRPSGRNRMIRPGVVHAAALELGLPVLLPEKIGAPEARGQLAAWAPEVIVVASYGQYIPTKVLQLPPRGVINVHPSLLPKYRGAAPMQWSLAKGDAVSGVTIFRVVKEMDAGDILLQEEHVVDPDETAVMLSERFSAIGARMALEAVDQLANGTARAVPQDHAAATFAPKINKADGLLDWMLPARELHNRIRGFQPWPCGYFYHDGMLIKVWRSSVAEGNGQPGEVLDTRGDGPLIATGEGAIRLLELQPEGKKNMTGRDFLNGHKWATGFVLETPDFLGSN